MALWGWPLPFYWKKRYQLAMQQTGAVRLLHKQGSRTDLSNWRPRLQAHFLSQVFATYNTRLRSILGRSISDSLNTVRDILRFCEKSNCSAAVLSLDQTEVFHRVNRDYLFTALGRVWFRSYSSEMDLCSV